MAQLMNEIKWGEPIVPVVRDPEWETWVKNRMGNVPDSLQRIAPSPWLRMMIVKWPNIQPQHLTRQQKNIASLVVAQENACRFCYGIARTYLRVYGLSESAISKLERQMHIAELDERDRAFIRFCRDLARSNPRPSLDRREGLKKLGFSDAAVAETAFIVGISCFLNRVATFLACPPMSAIEKIPGGLLGRIMRPMIQRKLATMEWTESSNGHHHDQISENFPQLVNSLRDIPMAAELIQDGMRDVFASDVLSQELKVLMFAVVAKSLECKFCHQETANMAVSLGINRADFDEAISSLNSPRLSTEEAYILAWTRETIHYQTEHIQRRTHALAQKISNRQLIDAVGVASVANMAVRLAVLLD